MRSIGLAVAVWLIAASGAAQEERYELGRRLKRMELAWEAADGPARAAAVEPLEAAVRSFFAFRQRTAAQRLDDAWYAVRGRVPTPLERWAVAQRCDLSPRLVEASKNRWRLRVTPFYDVERPAEVQVRLAWTLKSREPQGAAPRVWGGGEASWEELERGYDWPAPAQAVGDFRWEWQFVAGDERYEWGDIGASRVERLTERLDAVRAFARQPASTATATGRDSIAQLLPLLDDLAAGKTLETDYPADRLLRLLEALVAADGDSRKVLAEWARTGDVWATLSSDSGVVPVRMRAPAARDQDSKPLGVLVLLHGAGGSENMFFDTYGAGRAVQLGLERRYLVVAPRQGLFGLGLGLDPLLDVLASHFEIDRRNVVLLGHSMGAAQLTRQAARHPKSVRAAIALGGGGTASDSEDARRVPWFIAAGARDFGRPGASALAKRLESTGARTVYKEYPDVEHLAIVQASLDDAFRWLDQLRKAD